MVNGVSKNPSFRADFKHVNLILVKSAPKKRFCQTIVMPIEKLKVPEKIIFLGKTF
jgi:hypothetical protein